jgi:hypothetical protein
MYKKERKEEAESRQRGMNRETRELDAETREMGRRCEDL